MDQMAAMLSVSREKRQSHSIGLSPPDPLRHVPDPSAEEKRCSQPAIAETEISVRCPSVGGRGPDRGAGHVAGVVLPHGRQRRKNPDEWWRVNRCPPARAAASGQDDPTPIGKGVDSVSRGVIPRFWPSFRLPAPSFRRPEGRITRDGRGRRNASPPGGAGMCFRWKKMGGGGLFGRVPVAGGGPPGSRPRDSAAGGAWFR